MHTIKITYNLHDNNMYAYRQKNCITWKYFCQTFIAVIGSHLEDVWEVSEVEDVVEFDGCWKKSGCHLREEGRKEGREGGREGTWVGSKTWGKNWNWRKLRPMTLWSKQLGEQCWAHLVYGAVETKLISSSVFVSSSLCKALLVLFVVWSQVMCAMFL